MCDGCGGQFEKYCKPEFKALKDGQAKMHKRLFESNGEEALVVTVNRNAEQIGEVATMIKDHVLIPEPIKTKQIRIGKNGVEAKNMSPAEIKDTIKFIIGGVIVLLLALDHLDVGTKILNAIINLGG